MTLPPLCASQPHFDKLMRRKWLSSPEALDGIVGTLGAQALALRRMQDEPYQVRLLGGGGAGSKRALQGGRPPAGRGAALAGCARWRCARDPRGGAPLGIRVQGECRQGGGLWVAELGRMGRRLGWGALWGPGADVELLRGRGGYFIRAGVTFGGQGLGGGLASCGQGQGCPV